MPRNSEIHQPTPERPREHEPSELAPFRDFITDTMAFADTNRLETRTAQELLDDLAAYWNTPASFEHFLRLMFLLGNSEMLKNNSTAATREEELTTNDALRDRFTAYLLGKLPQELRPRWEAWLDAEERSVDDLLRAVSNPERGLVLGFHTSPRAIAGDAIRISSSDDVFHALSANEHADTTAKSWYSLDRQNLYGAKNPQFLYIVEGQRDAVGKTREYQRGHVISHAPTPIRCRIPLTPQVTTLGLHYGLEGSI